MKIDKDDIIWHTIFFGAIVLLALRHDRIIESVILFFCVEFIRYSFPKTYHHKTYYGCLAVSITVAALAIPQTLPIGISFLSPLVIGFLIGWYAHFYQERTDKFNATISELEIVITKFADIPKVNPYALDEETLHDHCRSLGLDDEYCKIANMFIYQKLKGKEFYKAIGYSERQSIRIRDKIKLVLGI